MLPLDPDSQARVFYLVLLGAFLLVYLFTAYRHRLGQALQHAAIWVLIFMGAVIAIGYWEPLKSQLYVDRAMTVGEDTLALRRAPDGHFYATAEVNGAPVRFMVDTGASDLVLTEADARAAGFDTERLNYVIPTITANGRTMSAPVRLQTVALGGLVDSAVPASVSGGELDQSLLGMRYLERFSSIRFEGNMLYLRR
jgi:aspartyl protease family protein